MSVRLSPSNRFTGTGALSRSSLPSWIGRQVVVGVFPRSAFHARARLFRTLERALPVRFEPRASAEQRALDAAIVFGDEGALGEPAGSAGLPVLIAPDQRPADHRRVHTVYLADVDRLDRRLRSRRLESLVIGSGLPGAARGALDIGTTHHQRVWQTNAGAPRTDRVAVGPVELEPWESLRDQLRNGRYLRLLPLFDFLRDLTGYRQPDDYLRATFIIDDPNLHWRSYGCIRFDRLAMHAEAHGYHVTFATVPLDCWFAWPGAVRTFRTGANALSLTSHGAYHGYSELTARQPDGAATRLFEDATARMDRFTRRWGVSIGRVMVPPHSASALSIHRPLLSAGFEALCTQLGWWADWPEAHRAIAGVAMADISPAGLPVFARHHIDHAFLRDDALMSAYLDQPLVVYGHAEDLAEGYDVLAEIAAWIREIGPTRWLSLVDVARTNLLGHFDARSGTFHLRLLARRGLAIAPTGARALSVEGPGCADDVGWVTCAGVAFPVHATPAGWRAEHVPCEGGRAVEVVVGRERRGRVEQRPRVAPVRAYARRAAVETRDRLRPAVRQVGLEAPVGVLEETFRGARTAR
jgi:hypothetical protein